MVPTPTGKPGKIGKTDWKSQRNLPKILEKWGHFTQNTGKVSEF